MPKNVSKGKTVLARTVPADKSTASQEQPAEAGFDEPPQVDEGSEEQAGLRQAREPRPLARA